MKRYLFLAALGLAASATYAQKDLNTAADALRYSMDNTTGTARFRGLGGAMGAVGGDVSAMMINPAGSSIYNYNSGTVSLTSYNVNNSSGYFDMRTDRNDNNFDLNQVGAVFVFNNTKENAVMNKFTLGFNYENTNNFTNRIFMAGTNPTSSIADYFVRYANGIGNEGGITLNTLDNAYYENLNFIDQQAYLGYNAYLFDPVSQDPENTAYLPAQGVLDSNGYYQENAVNASGYNGKVAVNFSAQLFKKLYLGINLNAHFTDYIKRTSLYEDINNPSAQGIQWVQFDNERYTYGGGFSLNLGAIYKITENFRAGVAYESPTWYRLQDEITQSIVVNNPDAGGTIVTDPGATFVLDDYRIQTPSKWTGSLAYIFGTSGLLSIDGSLKDYSTTKYKGNDYGMLNNELNNNLGMAAEIRAGGEYRIKNFSMRGGYRYEQSPYKDGETIGDLWGASAGVGIAFGSSRLDLAYNYYQRKMNTPLLPAGPADTGFTDAARVKSTYNNITLSYTLDL